MKKMKLSDLNLKKCIYMSVGPHAKEGTTENESFDEIILRKENELVCGYSLWADSRPPVAMINAVFDKNDEIYAIMRNNGKTIKSEGTQAKYYIEFCGSNEEPKIIPEKINAIYSSKNKCSYALCVEKYIEIDRDDNKFYKSNYTRIKKDNKNCFFNGFELLEKNMDSYNGKPIDICYAAKLKYPFCVKISDNKESITR